MAPAASAKSVSAIAEGRGESEPGGEAAGQAATRQPHREADLAGRGSREELAEGYQVRIG